MTQTAEVGPSPTAAEARVPRGYRRLPATVWLDDLGRVVLEADPAAAYGTDDGDADHPHNCDAMGCGQGHVVLRARLPGPDPALLALGRGGLDGFAKRCVADMEPLPSNEPSPAELDQAAAAWRLLADVVEALAHIIRAGG